MLVLISIVILSDNSIIVTLLSGLTSAADTGTTIRVKTIQQASNI